MADVSLDTPLPAAPAKPASAYRKLLRNPGVLFGGTVIAFVVLMGLLAPWLGTIDPTAINPVARNKVPGAEFFMRTDTGERIKMVALFGTDDAKHTQLDWIRARSRHQILLIDEEQSVRPHDLSTATLREEVRSAQEREHYFHLMTQMRVKAGSDYIGFVRAALRGRANCSK